MRWIVPFVSARPIRYGRAIFAASAPTGMCASYTRTLSFSSSTLRLALAAAGFAFSCAIAGPAVAPATKNAGTSSFAMRPADLLMLSLLFPSADERAYHSTLRHFRVHRASPNHFGCFDDPTWCARPSLAPRSLAAQAGGARTAGAAARLARARELGADLSPPLLQYRRPSLTPNARRQPRRRGGGCTPRLGGPVCALRGDFENPGPRSAYAAR